MQNDVNDVLRILCVMSEEPTSFMILLSLPPTAFSSEVEREHRIVFFEHWDFPGYHSTTDKLGLSLAVTLTYDLF